VYQPGQHVRITHVNHDDKSMNHVIGRTGTVTGHVGEAITVKGLVASEPDKAYGFFPEEVEPA
jgi:ribosomal protein L21E